MGIRRHRIAYAERVRFGVVVLVGLALLTLPAQAGAAQLVVTKSSDSLDGICDADCSLREAVAAANATGAEDEIVLPSGVLRLLLFGVEDANAKGDIDVNADLTIRGAGPAATTIQSAVEDRAIDLHNPGADLHLMDLTVTGGRAVAPNDRGGGIRSTGSGELSLERVVVRGNLAQGAASYGFGGGIYKETGHLVVRDSTIVGNRGTGSGWGGGVFMQNAATSAEFTNVTIAENYAGQAGGAIYSNHAIPATLTHITIVGNEAGSSVGGVGGDAASFRLRSSIVAANMASTAANCDSDYVPLSDGGNVGDPTCGLVSSSDVAAAAPGLGPLTATAVPVREPLPGSPAIDRAIGPCPPGDARGLARPQGPACDAGAAEFPMAIPPQTQTRLSPRLGRLPKRLKLLRGKVLVPLRCAAAADCRGRLVLDPVRRRKRATAQATKKALGRKAFQILAGRGKTFRVPLTAAGRRAVRGRKSVRAKLTARLTGVAGAKRATVRIVRPKRKPRSNGA